MMKLINYIKSMFKKKPELHYEIHFNKEKLQNTSGAILDRLHLYKHDDCMKDILYLINIGKNISLLECASARDEKESVMSKARLEVFSKLQGHFETAVNKKVIEAKEGKKSIPGTINIFRRTSNQAGSSI